MKYYPHFIRKMYVVFSITLFSLSLSGCSVLGYFHEFEIDANNSQWVKMNDIAASKYRDESAQYKNNIMTATIRKINTGSACIFVGPPLLPVLPFYPACVNKSLGLDIELVIDNLSNDLAINFKEVKLLKPPDQAIHVCFAPYCPVGDGRDLQACSNGNIIYAASSLISTWHYVMKKDTYTFKLHYCEIGYPEELTLEFGKMISEGREINIPHLKFKRRDKIGYLPLILNFDEDKRLFWLK